MNKNKKNIYEKERKAGFKKAMIKSSLTSDVYRDSINFPLSEMYDDFKPSLNGRINGSMKGGADWSFFIFKTIINE